MASYDNDTAFFDIVNSNSNVVNAKEKQESRLNEYFESTERAIQASIERQDIKAEDYRKLQERAEQLRKQRNLRVGALILTGALFLGGLGYGGKKFSDYQNIKAATAVAVKEAEDNLSSLLAFSRGTFTYSSDENVKKYFSSLSKEDYERLNITNVGDVYSYKMAINDDNEFEEFIRSMKYLENGEERNYTSFKQFLNINGFGSEHEFVNRAQAIILESYGDNVQKGKGGI